MDESWIYSNLQTFFTIIALFLIIVALRQRLFATWYAWFMSVIYYKQLEKTKSEFFSKLTDVQSLDSDLRKQGVIRILELGVGPGVNFKYYPKNARIIAVDPNPYFKTYIESNADKDADCCGDPDRRCRR